MMDKEKLYNLLKSEYKTSTWKEIVTAIFPNRDFFSYEVPLGLDNQYQKNGAKKIVQFGDITLDDGVKLALFEVEIQPGKKISKNRVELRNLLSTQVIPGIVDGALISYYEKGQKDWRFTFISKSYYWDEQGKAVKKETHPKRYTYVLGKDESCITPRERFLLLIEKKKKTIKDVLEAFSVEKISKEFFSKYAKDYQIILFTHDKGFFNEMLRQVNNDIDNWTAVKMYETPIDQNPKVELDKAGNLDKAIEYYIKRDYESCALYLRKETEETLSKYLDPDLKFIWSTMDWKGLSDFIPSAEKKLTAQQIHKIKMLFSRTDISDDDYDKLKTQIETDPILAADLPQLGKLKSFRNHVFNTLKEIKQQKNSGKDVYDLMEKIKHIKDRVLNAGAHFSEAPFYEEEIEEAIETVIELRKTLTNQDVTRYLAACRAAGMSI